MTTAPVHRALRIAYDGTPFHGFQRQPAVATVEDALLDAFDDLGVDALDAGYAAAGRTDAGVSAAAQTISLAVPDWLGPGALNAHLPATVRAWAAADVAPDFHPRYDATERVYTYVIGRENIDIGRARDVADALVGVHDFRDLSAASEGTNRELSRLDLEAEGDGEGELIRITAAAPGFIHQQVRRMVALVEAVASGQRERASVDRILDPDRRVHGGEGIAPAPPEPLVLADVRYDDVRFVSSAAAREAVVSAFRDRASHLRGRAAAMGAIADRPDRDDQHP